MNVSKLVKQFKAKIQDLKIATVDEACFPVLSIQRRAETELGRLLSADELDMFLRAMSETMVDTNYPWREILAKRNEERKLRTESGFDFTSRNPSLDRPRPTSILDLGSLLIDKRPLIDFSQPVDDFQINLEIARLIEPASANKSLLRPQDLTEPTPAMQRLVATSVPPGRSERYTTLLGEITPPSPIDPERLNRWPFPVVGQVIETYFDILNGQSAACILGRGTLLWQPTVFVVRDDKFIFNGKVSSLRSFGHSISAALEGQQFGITLYGDDGEDFTDFQPGDLILQNKPRPVEPQ